MRRKFLALEEELLAQPEGSEATATKEEKAEQPPEAVDTDSTTEKVEVPAVDKAEEGEKPAAAEPTENAAVEQPAGAEEGKEGGEDTEQTTEASAGTETPTPPTETPAAGAEEGAPAAVPAGDATAEPAKTEEGGEPAAAATADQIEGEPAAATTDEGNNAGGEEGDGESAADDGYADLSDLESDSQALEEAHEVMCALEELGGIAAQAPLTEQSAKILQVATEHLLGQLGYPESVKIVPALESFATNESAVTATQLALEGIAKRAQEVFKAIGEMIRKAIQWLKVKFAAYLDGSKALEARIKKLQHAVTEAKSEHYTSSISELGGQQASSLVSWLHIDGEIPQDLAGEAEKTAVMVMVQLEAIVKNDYVLNDSVIAEMLEGTHRRTAYMGEEEAGRRGLKHKGERQDDQHGYGTNYHSDVLLGNNVVEMAVGPKNTATVDRETGNDKGTLEAWHWRLKTAHLAPYTKGDAVKKSATVPVLALDKMEGVLNAARGFIAIINDFRETQRRLETLAEKFANAAVELAKKDGHGSQYGSTNDQITGSLQRLFLSSAPRILVHEPASFVNYAMRCATYLTQYVDLSLKTYGKDKPAPEQK